MQDLTVRCRNKALEFNALPKAVQECYFEESGQVRPNAIVARQAEVKPNCVRA